MIYLQELPLSCHFNLSPILLLQMRIQWLRLGNYFGEDIQTLYSLFPKEYLHQKSMDKGACAVLCRKCFLFLNSPWKKVKECGEAERVFNFPPYLSMLQKKEVLGFFVMYFQYIFPGFLFPRRQPVRWTCKHIFYSLFAVPFPSGPSIKNDL